MQAAQKPPPEDALRPFKILLAGGMAGAVSRTATAPVDRVKMLLQAHDGITPMTVRQGFRQMASEGTLQAFFRGNGTNVVKIAPETAIKLTFNDRIKRIVCHDPDRITPLQRLFAGAMSGAAAQFAIYPLELVRTRLAVCPLGTYKGMCDCFIKIARQEGYLAFYRGLLPSLLGILPYAGVDIAVFEILKEHLLDKYENQPPPILILGAGMVSSSIAQFASYPLALVRTRLQAQGYCNNPIKYKGMVDVWQQAIRKEGIAGLYKGILPNLAKVAPAAGISWVVFEEVKLWMGVDPKS